MEMTLNNHQKDIQKEPARVRISDRVLLVVGASKARQHREDHVLSSDAIQGQGEEAAFRSIERSLPHDLQGERRPCKAFPMADRP